MFGQPQIFSGCRYRKITAWVGVCLACKKAACVAKRSCEAKTNQYKNKESNHEPN